MNKAYNPIDWKNEPNTSTPINETNLNKMDRAIDTIDDRVVELDSGKVDKVDGKSLVSDTDIQQISTNKDEIKSHVENTENPHSVTKSQVGLGKVDNTSDSDKPISTAQQLAFDELNNNLAQLEYGDVAGGKNLWDEKWEIGSFSTSTGEKEGTTTAIRTVNPIKVKPNTLYTIINTSGFGIRYFTYKADGTYIGTGIFGSTFTTTEDMDYINFHSGQNPITYNNNIAIIEGTATDYEPYIPSVKMLAEENAQQSTAMLDLKMLGYVVPSEMPVKNYVDSDGVFHKRVGRVDLGDLDWTYSTSSLRMYVDLTSYGIKPAESSSSKPNIYCIKYETLTDDDTQAHKKGISVGTNGSVVVYDSSYTDATAFKAAMKGVYLYYELAEEKTISVDGNEAVVKVNESLGDYGLNGNHSIEIVQGYPSDSDITQTYTNSNYVCSENAHECNGGDFISIKSNYTVGKVYFFDSSKTYISQADFPCTAPSNAKYFRFRIGYVANITPSTVGNVGVYINNAIDSLKSDLGKVIRYGTYTSSIDANTIHEEHGVYVDYVNTSSGSNLPNSSGSTLYGILVTFNQQDAYRAQIAIDSTGFYHRRYWGGWNDWYKATSTKL